MVSHACTQVAVKILKDGSHMALGDFRTELNVLQKVHHPHTVQFLGAVTKTQPFMIVTGGWGGVCELCVCVCVCVRVCLPWRRLVCAWWWKHETHSYTRTP